MRGTNRTCLTVGIAAVLLVACGRGGDDGVDPVPGVEGAAKSAPGVRAERRAYDGAPPVIPHPAMGAPCISCHNERGIAVDDLGFAPPTPHLATAGLSQYSRCEQCHVRRGDAELLTESTFVGLAQDLRTGSRLHPLAPPVMPHPVFMRENCLACHTGPAAREPIRTPHPERTRCRQCHLEQTTASLFPAAN